MAAAPLTQDGDAVAPSLQPGAQPQGGDRQAGEQHAPRSAAGRPTPPPARSGRPPPGGVTRRRRRLARRAAVRRRAARGAAGAEHREREQGEAEAAQATRLASGQPAGGAPAGRALHHQRRGVPRASRASVPGSAWTGSSTTVQRAPAAAPGNGRVSVGKLDAGGHPPGAAGVAERLEREQRHGAEARLVVEVRARELLRQLVEQALPGPGDRHAVGVEQQQGAATLPLPDLDLAPAG